MSILSSLAFSKNNVIAILAALLCVIYVKSFQENADYRDISIGDSSKYIYSQQDAHMVEDELHQMGCRTLVLDSDNVRYRLCGDRGFSDADRKE